MIKDLSDLHNAAVQLGRPEFFDKQLEAAMLQADYRFFSSSRSDPYTDGDEEKNQGFSVSALEFAEAAGQARNWLCEGILEKGAITSLAGLAKHAGKTTFVCHLVDHLIRGEDFIELAVKEISCGVYVTEQGNNFTEALKKSGLINALEDKFRIVPYDRTQGTPWPKVIEKAVEECDKYSADLLVVDTFAGLADIRGSEENNSGDIAEKMDPLKWAARIKGLAVFFTRHAGKDGTGRGSSQFDADVDTILDLKRPSDGSDAATERVLESIGRADASIFKMKLNLTDEGYVRLNFDATTTSSSLKRAIKAVVSVGVEHAVSEKEIRDMILRQGKLGEEDFSESSLHRTLTTMYNGSEIDRTRGSGKGGPWAYFFSSSRSDPYIEPDEEKEFGSTPPPKDLSITRVDTEEKLSDMVSELADEAELGLDIETYPRDETARSLDPRRGQIGAISIGSAGGKRAHVIDVKSLHLPAVREAVKGVLARKPLVTHNGAGFDMPFLRALLGYEHDGPVYDTMVLDGLHFYATGPLSEAKDGNWKGFLQKDKERAYTISLAEVVEKRLGYTLGKELRDEDWGGIITPAMVEYAAMDAAVLLPLKDELLEELKELGMSAVADLEARFTPTMTWCATNGFKLDIEGWKEHARQAKEKMKEARARCDELAGEPPEEIGTWGWNASNHRKVGATLEVLGAKVQKREGTGNYITDEGALSGIKSPKKARELAQAILEYRAVEKYVTTWGEGWFREPKVSKRTGKIPSGKPDHLMIVDGRVYSKYNQLVVTGRGSSKYPNLQNLPADLRGYFVAPPGRVLLVGDYDQVEYVAAAHIAGDEQLLRPLREALGRGEKFDFHAITARMILESIHNREVTDEEVAEFRSKAKTVNFGVLYGMTYKSLAKKLSVTPRTALGYIDALFANAPKLKEWSNEQKAKAKRGDNLARTVLGRARLADLERRGGEWKANASQMLNHPVQGSCAEGYKIAAAMLYEGREEFAGNPLLVNMVHDEMVVEIDAEHVDAGKAWLERCMLDGMRQVLGPSAPISVEITIADNWGEKE